MRTPHGDADVSVVSYPPSTTVGDLVAAVTGQAVPRLVQIDERVVDATTRLDGTELRLGSVLTSDRPSAAVESEADVDLVQIAGHGAGRVARLGPGRYRIGPGRRSSADELAMTPVEQTVLELVVEPTTTASQVVVVAHGPDAAIAGTSLRPERQWSGGTLTVGSRAFELEAPARSEPARALAMPESDGCVAFSRPPRRRSAPVRRPVVDAVRDATLAAPTLWERRPGHPDAFSPTLGVRGDDSSAVTVDLRSERAVAIAGSERFRSALVRTLVVESVTLHGPSDLDLVVLTDHERLAHWDWAKWLPHLRLDGPPALWSARQDIIRWAEGATGRAVLSTTPWMSSHLTVVIIDDPGLWNRRESPLRSIMSNPPDDLRVIALCDGQAHAPAVCTTVISETEHDFARLQSFTRSDDSGDFRPALTETTIAVRVARSLAPLADVDLPAPPPPPIAVDRVEIADIISITTADAIEDRWVANTPGPAVVIGQRGHHHIELPLADDVTIVEAPTIGDAFDVAATWLLGQTVERSPDALWIAPLVHARTERSDWLWRLPHATDPYDLDWSLDPGRLLTRLRSVVADPAGPARIVIVTEAPSAADAPADLDWFAALADGVHATDRLALVVVTDRSEVTIDADTVVHVDIRSTATGLQREATIASRGAERSEPFAPLTRSMAPNTAMDLRPFVVGRALSPLERRIERQRAASLGVPDAALNPLVNALREADSRRPHVASARTVVPPPLPTRVDLDELFDGSPGDGVPLGLIDDAQTAGVQTRWWQPRSGSMLVYGSRRSGLEQVLVTVLLGVIDRFSDLDVRLVVVEPSSARRRALAHIDRAVHIVNPDQKDGIVEMLDDIDATLDRNGGPGRDDAAHLVVLINDLAHVRRRCVDRLIADRIDTVLTRAAAPDSGVDVIASVAELDGAGPFAAATPQRLVGASSDHGELASLGVDRPSELEGIIGRCRSFPDGDLVQIATSATAAEILLARRSIGGDT